MCLLLACVGVVRDHPVVCVANRDEFHDRPSDPVADRGGAPRVWCGLDRRAGGTWLGMNDAGVVVVLTNRRGEQDASRVSRGGIVLGALQRRIAYDAASCMVAWAEIQGTNPFSLFVADERAAWFAAWDGPGGKTHLSQARPGLHTLTNTHSIDELSASEVMRAADGGPVELPHGISLADAEPRLLRVAKSHAPLEGGPRSAVCVHEKGRGTVSSALLAVDDAGRPARFLAADGPPCVTAYRDVLG